MPEGDTVWLTAKRLTDALAGTPVVRSDIRTPRLALVDLTGRTMSEAVGVGKHLLMRFDDGHTLHSHLRMDGSWFLRPTGSGRRRGPDHAIRAILGTAEWEAVGYRIHDLSVLRTEDEARVVGHLGPDILAPDWDDTGRDIALATITARPDATIGEAVLDQRNLAGIGNLYKLESLFVQRVNPFLTVGEVDVGAVLDTAHRLMLANRDHPAQTTTGYTGRGNEHWVYGRLGEPCLRCRTPINRAEQGVPPQQRVTYWCPRCQPGPTPPGVETAKRRRRY